jgi:hypothetical protein
VRALGVSWLVGMFAPLGVLGPGCGGNDHCDPASSSGCTAALQCEAVAGADPACLPPVVVAGRLLDSATGNPVAGARVLVLGADGAPAGPAVASGGDGAFAMRVPSPRRSDHSPVGQTVTLRADASGYQRFPAGFRPGVAADTAAAALASDGSRLLVTLPDVTMIAIVGGVSLIAGRVELPSVSEQVLVLAVPELGGRAVSAIADTGGVYQIPSLTPDTYDITAYARGFRYGVYPTTVGTGQATAVDVRIIGPTAAHVLGRVDLAPGTSPGPTSVLLVPDASFDAAVGQIDLLPGMRVALPGPGQFSFDGVPDGLWVVLAGFENDGFVAYNPSNLPVPRVQVLGGVDTDLSASAVVVDALGLIAPGASGPQAVAVPPMLTWVDDTNEDHYHVVVTDALGGTAWTHDEPAHAGDNPAVPYTGPLAVGMFYRFQVQSLDRVGNVLRTTEPLRGVFVKPAP